MTDVFNYRPAGPVMKAFHESNAFFRALAGPIGSSKTTGAGNMEPVFGALCQRPNSDGVRTFKSGVLRDTYRNLYATTMKTWHKTFPKEVGDFKGSDDRPAEHNITLEMPGGVELQISVEFRALGKDFDVEATCRGWELNGAYVDEADLCPSNAITYLGGRVMRAGDAKLRQTRGVWFTFNKPDVEHYLYNWCEEDGFDGELPEELAAELGMTLFAYFNQPAGLLPGMPYRTNPAAENLQHLDKGYYIIAAAGAGADQNYVRRMVRNEWGASGSGQVVYPSYNAELHVAAGALEPPAGSILRLGLDGGGTPAAVIGGRDGYGRRIIYGEVVIEDPNDAKGRTLMRGVGPTRFAKAIAEKLGEPRFRGCRVEMGFGDPAAFYGADREMGEYSFMETVAQKLGLPIQPADSNEIHLRHEAVAGLMNDLGEDGRPRLIISGCCKWLRRGFAGDYKLEKVDKNNPGKELKPQKTLTSHVHDALQYYCLGDVGRAGVTGGGRFDRYQASEGGVFMPTAPPATPSTGAQLLANLGGRATVKGTHYHVDFNPWRSS